MYEFYNFKIQLMIKSRLNCNAKVNKFLLYVKNEAEYTKETLTKTSVIAFVAEYHSKKIIKS